MKLSELENLIDKYLCDRATDEEKSIINNWLQHNTDDARIDDPLKRQELVSSIWENINHRIHAPEEPSGIIRSIRRIQKKYVIRVAASLLFVAMAGILVYYFSRSNTVSSITYAMVKADEKTAKQHVLPDGSIAWLFPGSSIDIPENYNAADRHVRVTGRAFFEIQQSSSKPFYVDAGSLQTLVLGTSFEVNTLYAQQPSVVVRTGRVAVSWQGKQVIQLGLNQRLRLDVSGARPHAAIDSVNANAISTWWSGAFNFEQTPLTEVLQNLSEWYKMPIGIAGEKWKEEKVTIQIETNLSLREAMHLLCETLGTAYHMNAQGVSIK